MHDTSHTQKANNSFARVLLAVVIAGGCGLFTGCFSLLARLPEPTTVINALQLSRRPIYRCSNRSPSAGARIWCRLSRRRTITMRRWHGIGARPSAPWSDGTAGRVARGELAMGAGPIATDIDRALRILICRAAPAMYQRMDPQGKAWLEAYCQGVTIAMAQQQNQYADYPIEHRVPRHLSPGRRSMS